MQTLCLLEEKAGIEGQFIPGTQEMSGNAENFLPLFRPTSMGEVIDDAIHWVSFHGASNDVQFSVG